jgi:hypothetical protein
MIPATFATVSTSPFAISLSRMALRVAGSIRIDPRARAIRSLGALWLTSTMRAWPESST